jgi:signal transduction histidine kinase
VDVLVESTDDGAVLTVRDDGTGFESSAGAFTRDGHFGLAGMAQRASMVGGRFAVESHRGGGTIVSVWVPREAAA